MLTTIQKDALAKTLNAVMGLSANLLSEEVNRKIILSVPFVELKQGFEIHTAVLDDEDMLGAGKPVIHMVTFGDECSELALVIFRQDGAGVLANACMGNVPDAGSCFSNEDADVIREICSILLNAIAYEIGKLAGIRPQHAQYIMDLKADVLDEKKVIPPEAQVLVVHVSFFLADSMAKGIMLIVLAAPSFEMFMNNMMI